MPTNEEMLAAVQKIEWLESMSYFREEGRVPETASDCFLPWWEDLTRNEQQSVLEADVDWAGFSESQKEDVITRVLDGMDVEFWMDGIADKALFNEWREDEAFRFEGKTPAITPEQERRLFEVWHQSGDGYDLVASVANTDQVGAVVKTTHGEKPWQDNPGVTAEPGEHRSTEIGDKVVSPWGTELTLTDKGFRSEYDRMLDEAGKRGAADKGKDGMER